MLRVFFDRIDTEAVLEHIQYGNSDHESARGNDRHVGKRSRHGLKNDRPARRDLAVSSREALTQALAREVQQRPSTDSTVETRDIGTVVHSRLTASALPAIGT